MSLVKFLWFFAFIPSAWSSESQWHLVLARGENRTVMTLAGSLSEGSSGAVILIPVPAEIERKQIHTVEWKTINRLILFSSPQVSEQQIQDSNTTSISGSWDIPINTSSSREQPEIKILPPNKSTELIVWLIKNRIKPSDEVLNKLRPLSAKKLSFVLVKYHSAINPLQIDYLSSATLDAATTFLPIILKPNRVGMMSELNIYTLSRKGKTEVSGYRATPLPSQISIGTSDLHYLPTESLDSVMNVFTGVVSHCAPCTTDPLARDELHKLGAFWVEYPPRVQTRPKDGKTSFAPIPIDSGVKTFLTRFILWTGAHSLPLSLLFQETDHQDSFKIHIKRTLKK